LLPMSAVLALYWLVCSCPDILRALHSFPTRRSSDLLSILPELISGGVKHFRLEALYENPGEIKEKIALYQMALQGKPQEELEIRDRKSTRLNSSHVKISYAVFCLKKKTTTNSMTICT